MKKRELLLWVCPFLILAIGCKVALIRQRARQAQSIPVPARLAARLAPTPAAVTSFDAAGVWPAIGDGDDKPSTVRALQYLLRGRGYNVLVDGRFGEKTRSRVEDFQLKQRLWPVRRTDPGVADGATWEFLAPDLKRGDKGLPVHALQTLLRSQGYKVAVDGQFGKQTEQAVLRFQKQRDLVPSNIDPGVVERFTWCELTGGAAYRGGGC